MFVEQLLLSKHFINRQSFRIYQQSPRIIEFKLLFLQYNNMTPFKILRQGQIKIKRDTI